MKKSNKNNNSNNNKKTHNFIRHIYNTKKQLVINIKRNSIYKIINIIKILSLF